MRLAGLGLEYDCEMPSTNPPGGTTDDAPGGAPGDDPADSPDTDGSGFHTRRSLAHRGDPRDAPVGRPHTRERRRRSSTKRRHRRKIRRRIYLAVAVLAAIGFFIGVLAVLRLQKIAAELNRGRAEAEAAVDSLKGQRLAEARTHLAAAADAFVRGRHSLQSSVELKLMGMVPWVGDDLRTVKAIATTGAVAADSARNVLEAARMFENAKGEFAAPISNGRIDLAALEAFEPSVAAASDRVATATHLLGETKPSGFVGSIESAQSQLLLKMTDFSRDLKNLDGYLQVLPPLLGQNERRRYLVAIGNDAEMNANGMVLSYGVIEASGGKLEWARGGPVTDLRLSRPAGVELDPEYMARWGWANPTFAWQRTNVSPEYPIAGEIMDAMYKQKTGTQVDGVIYMDGVALGYLLRATGPITFDDPAITLDERNFAEFAMNKAYTSFASQQERKEFLGLAAGKAVTTAFSITGERARTLGTVLGQAARERRLMIWSNHKSEQMRLASLSLGGGLGDSEGGFFSYTLENFGGNKLDYYMTNKVNYQSRIDSEGFETVTVRFDLANSATGELNPYILGYDPTVKGRNPGDYVGYLTVYAPTGAFLTGGASRSDVSSVLPDAGHAAFSLSVLVPAQGSRTIELEYRVPASPLLRGVDGELYKLKVVPQPRFRADSISIGVSFAVGSVGVPSGFASPGERTLAFDGAPQESVELTARWHR